jgi:hypothetical protein
MSDTLQYYTLVFHFYLSGSSYLNFDASIKIDDHLKRNFQVNVRANDIIKVLDELEKLGMRNYTRYEKLY